MYEEIKIEQPDGSFETQIVKYLDANNVICFPAIAGNPHYEEYLKVKAQNG